MPSRRGLDLEEGERLHYRGGLRFDDEIVVTDRQVLVYADEQVTSVPFENLSEVSNEALDWFLAVVSGSLAVFGVYSMQRNPLVGGGFALAGLWSLHRTYRHRNRVRIHTHSQAKPVEVFPEDVDELYAELEAAIEAAKAERE